MSIHYQSTSNMLSIQSSSIRALIAFKTRGEALQNWNAIGDWTVNRSIVCTYDRSYVTPINSHWALHSLDRLLRPLFFTYNRSFEYIRSIVCYAYKTSRMFTNEWSFVFAFPHSSEIEPQKSHFKINPFSINSWGVCINWHLLRLHHYQLLISPPSPSNLYKVEGKHSNPSSRIFPFLSQIGFPNQGVFVWKWLWHVLCVCCIVHNIPFSITHTPLHCCSSEVFYAPTIDRSFETKRSIVCQLHLIDPRQSNDRSFVLRTATLLFLPGLVP